ncbi:MAG: response regulator [Bacteroidetes bacterium]|nr:response regulator [Bacteroidota bacterium]
MNEETKLPIVMVLDQDEIFHFIVTKVLNRDGINCNVINYNSITSAVSYLLENAESEAELPDLILLELYFHSDQDGWVFIELFEKIKQRLIKQPKVLIVSYTMKHADMTRVSSHQTIFDFVSKPLDTDSIDYIRDLLKPANEMN